jgi:2-oxoisovalerate dehydrogenase E2 component (dihydrolipoyl transacylase)
LNTLKNKTNNSNQLSVGTISISHIGSLGAISMNPLIYGHLACHASIGSQRTLPVFNSGKILKREVVDVTMGCDHRVLDGATVAQFTSAWKEYSEDPTPALLNMI